MTQNGNQFPTGLSWEIFMKLYFSSDSLFSDIYLLIFINVPVLTSRDNDFKESRKMVCN